MRSRMDKKYFVKNSLTGFLFLIVAIVAFYTGDELFYRDVRLVVFMVLSTLLYPLSRYLIQATAYRFKSPIFWKKAFLLHYSDISGVTALFAFFCIAFAIPIGSIYLTYMIFNRGATKAPPSSR